LLAKPTPRNVNLGSDRFAMFNKERDIPIQYIVRANASATPSVVDTVDFRKNPNGDFQFHAT
jgi:hypothetical protein